MIVERLHIIMWSVLPAQYIHSYVPIYIGTVSSFACFAKLFNFFFFLFGWGTKVYVQNQSGPSNGILHRFCLTAGSTLTSQDFNPSSVVYVSKPIRAIWRYLSIFIIRILCLALLFFTSIGNSKFEFQVPHSNLNTNLASDQKWSLSCIQTSRQISQFFYPVKTTSIIKNIHSYIPILLTVGEITNK